MKKNSKTLGLTLALLIGMTALTGCPGQGPTSPDGKTQINAAASIQKTPVEAQNALTSFHEDEAGFIDSEAVADESGLKIKAGPLEKITATKLADVKKVIADKTKLIKENVAKSKDKLQASGAVKVNDDGTITVDPAKLKTVVKQGVDAAKIKIKATAEKFKDKLVAKAEVAKAKVEKLRRKNNVARTSEVVTVTNDDGSITKTMTVHFENSKLGVTRDIITSRTFKDDKLVSSDYSLEAKTTGFTKSATRTVTVNADGSRKIVTQSTTTWTSGKIREINEERIVNADGTATGTGTVTVTLNGQTKTYNITIGISASSEITTTATDPESKTTVTLDESADGTATVVVAEPGQPETETPVNVEEAAAAEGTVPAETTPVATATPAP